ncbi:hypothetical protein [Thalassotalea sp. G2M2-11]|uniref:hypothetical protein n=1 Tax=Thalassotalea sp. G2M2-11 TaxID=2787627 RepID=UPI0019D1F055|nr:hypothetical protein [Thalassotalea sp. G2M2-11]
MKIIIVVCVALILSACTTRHFSAPVGEYPYSNNKAVSVVNDQLDTQERVFFSDGITTVLTDYKGWSEILISKVHNELAKMPLRNHDSKILKLSISSIICGGHYVTDCTVSAIAQIGDGYRNIISSSKFNGYPATSALDKALNDTAAKIMKDEKIVSYLLN